MPTIVNITPEVRAVLSECTATDNSVALPKKVLDRQLYQAVNKALENAGGRWDRKAQAHLFESDPRPRLAEMLDTGIAKDNDDSVEGLAELAREVVELACIEDGDVVLEPSAGEGALANAILANPRVGGLTCVEIDPVASKKLEARLHAAALRDGHEVNLYRADFLKLALKDGDFDRVVMNPPYDRMTWLVHVEHALRKLKVGGILVAIIPAGMEGRPGFQLMARNHHYELTDVAEGAFKESGTLVNTQILKLTKGR